MAIKLKSNNGNIDLTSTSKVIRGIDGGYYTPVIDEEGNLTWVASLTDMEDIAAINIMGPEGKPGLTGPAGKDGVNGKDGAPGKDGKDGIDGKDGEKGEPGVYVGTTEPTDPEMLIWINPEGGESTGLATKEYVDEAIAAALEGIENGTY